MNRSLEKKRIRRRRRLKRIRRKLGNGVLYIENAMSNARFDSNQHNVGLGQD